MSQFNITYSEMSDQRIQ